MEYTACNLCSSRDTIDYRKVQANAPKIAEFNLVRCRRCGMIYLNPRPTREEMAAFYLLWPQAKKEEINQYHSTRVIWRGQKKKMNLLRRFLGKQKGRILDVGCGSGEFLSLMKKAGWQVTGLEYGKAASSLAREKFNIEVNNADLLDTHFADKSFEVVTFWHSLEHLYQPKETLEEVKRILKDDGLVFIALPNIDNLANRIFKDSWYTNTPRHLFQFTSRTIETLLAGVKFKIIKTIFRAGFFETAGFVVTFKTWLFDRIRIKAGQLSSAGRPIKSDNMLKTFLRLILEVLFLPLSLLSLLIKKGPNMVMVAKKC